MTAGQTRARARHQSFSGYVSSLIEADLATHADPPKPPSPSVESRGKSPAIKRRK
jgi:hypothetical protein